MIETKWLVSPILVLLNLLFLSIDAKAQEFNQSKVPSKPVATLKRAAPKAENGDGSYAGPRVEDSQKSGQTFNKAAQATPVKKSTTRITGHMQAPLFYITYNPKTHTGTYQRVTANRNQPKVISPKGQMQAPLFYMTYNPKTHSGVYRRVVANGSQVKSESASTSRSTAKSNTRSKVAVRAIQRNQKSNGNSVKGTYPQRTAKQLQRPLYWTNGKQEALPTVLPQTSETVSATSWSWLGLSLMASLIGIWGFQVNRRHA